MHLPRFLAFSLLIALLSGCATTGKVGIRDEFASKRVAAVAIAPLHASSSFGNAPADWERVRAVYSEEVALTLSELGFQTVGVAELEEGLAERESLEAFRDVLAFRRDISHYFEPDLYQTEPREVVLLRALASEGDMPTDVLFVGEIVYQSEGVCREDAREHNKHAEVLPGTAEGPRPCVISHFQAKLVDVKTGKTMWHNRLLREVRLDDVSEARRSENIRATVRDTLTGEHGLSSFAPRRSASVR